MVNILSVIASVPESIRDKFKQAYEELKNKYGRPDLAVVKAFQRAAQMDSTSLQICNEITADASPTLLGEDKNFWYRKVTLTTEGVNLNGFYKPREELEKTGLMQADHVIPTVNDHPEDPGAGIRVKPKDDEISGFVFGIRGEEGEDGKYRLVGIDAIPKDRPELLLVKGVSIGYVADIDMTPGEYKGVEYKGIQRNITLVHLARMVEQAPSCPPKVPGAPPGLAVGCGYDKKGGASTEGDEEDAEWTTKYINDLPDAAFAYIEPGGKKDEEGKTVPRSLRHLPHHTMNVKNPGENSTVDLPHLKNALARLPQSKLSAEAKAKAKAHLVRHAKALGVGNYDEEEPDMGDKEENPCEQTDAKVRELQDSLAEKAKALADAKAKLEAKDKEISDLKAKAEATEKELQALKDQIRESLTKALKDSYPDIFSEDEIKAMSDDEIRRLLKARTGQDYKPVIVVQETGADNDPAEDKEDEDTGWTVGVPGVAGWEEK